MDLFSTIPLSQLPGTPLAERMRPQSLAHLQGQDAVVKALQRYMKSQVLPNLIFWGPPGTGKTTLAHLLSIESKASFFPLHGVDFGTKELKLIAEKAQKQRQQYGDKTIVFIDEIHRLNKTQQDTLLPYTERGDFILIGATTENPSFEINRALLSRCRILILKRLERQNLEAIALTAFDHLRVDKDQFLSPEAFELLLSWSDGDARKILSALEEIDEAQKSDFPLGIPPISEEVIKLFLGQLVLGYDKKSDQHYNSISAFIKSVRGSDPDAAMYYLVRMLKGGEDPLFIARRLIILASEDIGNADPRALPLAVATAQALEMIGLPEGEIPLAQTTCYLASAPKSNRSYEALSKAKDFVEKTGALDIPIHLRPEGKFQYKYPHSYPKHWVPENYFPQENPLNKITLKSQEETKFYCPSNSGFEKTINEYLHWLKKPKTQD